MKEEILLEQKFGKRLPFKVPEGYFEHFGVSFMTNLQEREVKRLKRRKLFVRYAACAACVVMMAVSGFALFHSNAGESANKAIEISKNNTSTIVNDYAMDEFCDYAMIDRDDLYSYVTEE